MFDIEFYMKSMVTPVVAWDNIRSMEPVVYNIETTNACNMRCRMCPRTTLMTRKVESMSESVFAQIVEQLVPHSNSSISAWDMFCVDKYGVASNSTPSENHFFLHVIPHVVQLHGYGDPLLDKNMPAFVDALSSRGLKSYFSCNPSNIDIDAVMRCARDGLGYLKFSIESTDNERFRSIRGNKASFTDALKDIVELLRLISAENLNTRVVITMLDLAATDQTAEYAALEKSFAGMPVYMYLKSEDQQWYRGKRHANKSIHWTEPCKHPWMSMTIKSDGAVAMCMEDYNNEIVLGDAKTTSLRDIWNGEAYSEFREAHLTCMPGIKCTEYCDMPVVGCSTCQLRS